jgi:hypothetical protein
MKDLTVDSALRLVEELRKLGARRVEVPGQLVVDLGVDYASGDFPEVPDAELPSPEEIAYWSAT